MERRRTLTAVLVGAPGALFIAIFFAWPLATVMRRGLSGGALASLATDSRLRGVLGFTMWQAVASTVLTLIVGLPAAYALTRYDVPGRGVIAALSSVPFVLPTVVSGVALLSVLPDSWRRTVPALLIGHTWVNIAVVIRLAGAAFERTDPRLGDAAATLGASPSRRFRHVTLMLAGPAIIGAAAVVFLFCLTSFGLALLLGGPGRETIEVEIWRRTTTTLDLATSTALALVQFVIVGLLAVATTRHEHRRLTASSGSVRSFPRQPTRPWAAVATWLTGLVIAAPLAALAVRSLRLPDRGWTLDAWRALAAEQSNGASAVSAFGVSAVTMSVATVLAVALAFGATVALTRLRNRGAQTVAEVGLMLPLGVSAVTIGLGLILTFNRSWYDLRSAWIMLPLGQALVAVPFAVRVLLPAARSIPGGLLDAAATLGASPRRAWVAVEWPALRRACVVAAGFAAAVSLGEFGASSFLSRSGRESVPLAIGRLLSRPSAFNLAQAAALATALAAAVTVILALTMWRPRRVAR